MKDVLYTRLRLDETRCFGYRDVLTVTYLDHERIFVGLRLGSVVCLRIMGDLNNGTQDG